MFKRLQLYHLFIFAVGLIPLISIYLTLSDIFRQSSEWLLINAVISIACFLVTGGVFVVFLTQKKIDWVALCSTVLCTSLLWLYFYFDNPQIRAEWIKNAYLKDDISYQSWRIHEDFLYDKANNEILKDEVFIRKMMEKMKIANSYEWQQIAKGIYTDKYLQYGLMLVLALKQQGKTEEGILQMPHSQDLLFAVFLNETKPIAYLSDATFPSWVNQLLTPKPTEILKAGIVSKQLWQALVKKFIQEIETQDMYSCEMFVYLLTQIPTDISNDEFLKLMVYWAKLKPTYEEEILELAEKRNQIRLIGKEIGKQDTIYVDLLSSGDGSNSFNLLKPLVVSAGFIPVIADSANAKLENCLIIKLQTDMELLLSEKISIYQDIAKKRTKRGTGRYATTTTETYYERQYKGSEQKDTYSYFYSIKFKTKGNDSFKDSIATFQYLPHYYFDKDKKQYSISYEQMLRDECWLYALPKSWFYQ